MTQFQENFLQLVWKYQYFDKKQAVTEEGEPIQVVKIGFHNFHEGPDFKESHIRIGNMDYHGHVEVHLKSSDWNSHGHEVDPAYNSVILHVVWDHDAEICRSDGTYLPVLALKGKVFLDVVRNYERLLGSRFSVICGYALSEIQDILKFSTLEKALVERFTEKSRMVLDLLRENGGNWEETAYQWLFYCFGFKTNGKPMLRLARTLPYLLLKKHSGNRLGQEALIFGQSGLLNYQLFEEYPQSLVSEYLFLENKYSIKNRLYPSEWKFMAVRPGNYPTIRLAQLAALLHKCPNLLSTVLYEMKNRHRMHELFAQEVSPYWQKHYHFGKSSGKSSERTLSAQTLDLLAINFTVPLWYAYGQYIDAPEWQEKCFDFLQQIGAEENSIIRKFSQVGWEAKQAFDTQGMIGLYNNYCKSKRCLECKIGQNLLRPQTA
ncbi:DUF2851 family protein [Pleomorphovibrio marinus]|uniref:DUF2851 family protein n=1 Tax=Pleomorphovibrio marinus TaxID=2164132 RepID=UPI000E0CA3BE|nr:DUF2851 family protein [Pleomorphovibrio marinus]